MRCEVCGSIDARDISSMGTVTMCLCAPCSRHFWRHVNAPGNREISDSLRRVLVHEKALVQANQPLEVMQLSDELTRLSRDYVAKVVDPWLDAMVKQKPDKDAS
jgi:ribosome-binding protein aMBF1 (putative translation factor)